MVYFVSNQNFLYLACKIFFEFQVFKFFGNPVKMMFFNKLDGYCNEFNNNQGSCAKFFSFSLTETNLA